MYILIVADSTEVQVRVQHPLTSDAGPTGGQDWLSWAADTARSFSRLQEQGGMLVRNGTGGVSFWYSKGACHISIQHTVATCNDDVTIQWPGCGTLMDVGVYSVPLIVRTSIIRHLNYPDLKPEQKRGGVLTKVGVSQL